MHAPVHTHTYMAPLQYQFVLGIWITVEKALNFLISHWLPRGCPAISFGPPE